MLMRSSFIRVIILFDRVKEYGVSSYTLQSTDYRVGERNSETLTVISHSPTFLQVLWVMLVHTTFLALSSMLRYGVDLVHTKITMDQKITRVKNVYGIDIVTQILT